MKVINVTSAEIGGLVGNYGNKHVETPERSFIGRRVYLNGDEVQFTSPIDDAYIIVAGTDIHVFTDTPFDIPDASDTELKVNAGEKTVDPYEIERERNHYDHPQLV